MISLQVITSVEQWRTLAAEWDDLLKRSDSDMLFLTFDWLHTWWQSYGQGCSLFIMVARRDGALVGIAPLMKTKITYHGMSLNAVTFIANYHSNKADFIIPEHKKEILTAYMQYLFDGPKNFDIVELNFFLKGSDNETILSAVLAGMKRACIKSVSLISPYLLIHQDWNDYLASRGKSLTHKIKRRRKKMETAGAVELIKHESRDIEAAFSELLAVSRNTWKYEAGTAIASTDENIRFYSTYATIAAQRGILNLWVLKMHGQPIAFSYNVIYNNKVLFLKVGHDMRYAQYSPGICIVTSVIEDAFRARYAEFDWLGGDDPYKLQWTDNGREYYNYFIFSDTWRARMLLAVKKYIVPLFRGLLSSTKKETPQLEND